MSDDTMSAELRAWPLRAGALLLVVFGVFPLANYITTGAPMGWWPSALHDWIMWGVIVLVVVVALAAALPGLVDGAFASIERLLVRPSRRSFALGIALLTCGISLFCGWYLFRGQPIVGDEFVQQWQAHLLSTGHLFAIPESSQEFFSSVEAIDSNGKWFAQFPIGGPAMLAIGLLLHAPWLVGPLSAAAAAAALYLLASKIGDELTARGAALLFAVCPFVTFMAGSEMNHVPSLACTTIALAALAWWVDAQTQQQRFVLAATVGATLGVAATIRPFDAAIVAFSIGIFQLWTVRHKRFLAPSLLIEAGVCAIPVVLLLLVNWKTLGHPFAFGYDVLNGVEHRPGFHMTPLGFEHTLRRGLYNISAYLLKLNFGLFTWPVPAMLIVVATLALQRRFSAWDGLFLGITGLLLAGYTAYWSLSSYLGPRFLYTLAPFFVLYTARLPGAIRSRASGHAVQRATLLLIPAWLVIALVYPPRTDTLIGVQQLGHLFQSRAVAPAIADAVQKARLTNAVVFIREGWHARLAARLRAMTFRPLIAEEIVKQSDACFLHRTLNMADRLPDLPNRVTLVVNNMRADVRTAPASGLPPSDQISYVPGRPLSPECKADSELLTSAGASLAEMLPYEEYDGAGRLAGEVIYARDFGAHNEVLRSRFGNRSWFVAHVFPTARGMSVVLDPYVPPVEVVNSPAPIKAPPVPAHE